MVAQIIRREYARHFLKRQNKPSGTLYSSLFITGTAARGKRIRNPVYRHNYTKSTKLAEKGTLEEVLDCSINRWKPSALFVHASTRRAPNQSCLTRPVKSFLWSHMHKTAKEMRTQAKVKAWLPSKLDDPWPQPPPLPLSSDEYNRKKHWRSCRKTQVYKASYPEKRQTHQNRYSFTSSDRDKNSLFSDQLFFPQNSSIQSNAGRVPLKPQLSVTKLTLPKSQTEKGH